MSLLPHDTFVNASRQLYADLGSGGGGGSTSSLQSPASIVPDGTGAAALSVLSQSGALASITVGDGAQGNQSALIDMTNGGNGNSTIKLGYVDLVQGGFNGVLTVANHPTSQGVLSVDTFQNVVDIGSAAYIAGRTNQALVNVPMSITNGSNAMTLTATDATTSNIGQAVASAGSLVLGSSVACPATLTVSDTGAATGKVAVGGNGGSAITMNGGNAGSQTSIITTSATGVGSLLLGASAANDRAIFINDTGGAANTAVVDITKGTAAGIALRLQGYGLAGTAATVSTNSAAGVLHVSSGPADATPAIAISPTATTVSRAMTAAAGYTGITQQIINNGNSLAQLPWNITNPSLAGIYTILVRVGDNAAVNINGQINSVGYWNGSVWVAGACTTSQAIGTGNLLLWFGSTATSRTQLILQNTGSAEISGVAVYMIPQLIGLSSIIT